MGCLASVDSATPDWQPYTLSSASQDCLMVSGVYNWWCTGLPFYLCTCGEYLTGIDYSQVAGLPDSHKSDSLRSDPVPKCHNTWWPHMNPNPWSVLSSSQIVPHLWAVCMFASICSVWIDKLRVSPIVQYSPTVYSLYFQAKLIQLLYVGGSLSPLCSSLDCLTSAAAVLVGQSLSLLHLAWTTQPLCWWG